MAFPGLTVQNQLGFHEITNVIENASGNIFLDLEKSTRHVVYAIDDLVIYIEGLDPQNPIPKNKFIEIDLLIIPKKDNIKLTFDPTFIWPDSRVITNKIILYKNINLMFILYSIDSCTYWRILSAGSFGPDTGYSIIDNSASQIKFEEIIYSPLLQRSIYTTEPIILDFDNKIKSGIGKIIINEDKED